jgi:hypothetical protein
VSACLVSRCWIADWVIGATGQQDMIRLKLGQEHAELKEGQCAHSMHSMAAVR